MHQLDKDLPLYAVRTMDQMLDTSMARERMSMSIFVVFAAVALTLASVGLYGVVAHGVTERTHEIGVRMALGAEPRHVLRSRGQAGTVDGARSGRSIGVAGAMALSRSVQGLLFGVTATDPITFAAVVGDAARRRARRLLRPGVARDAPESNDGAAGGVENTIMADGEGLMA